MSDKIDLANEFDRQGLPEDDKEFDMCPHCADYQCQLERLQADRDAWQKQAEIQEESLRKAQAVVEQLLSEQKRLQAEIRLITTPKEAIGNVVLSLRSRVSRLEGALRSAARVLDRVSKHFHKIRPEHLEPSHLMITVGDAVGAANAALAAEEKNVD